MTSRVLLVTVLGLCACGGGDDPPPVPPDPGTCEDGLHNGDEADVDCGGRCADRCTTGSACTVDADCTFASCDAGTCAAPEDGPEPTGPIAGTLDPAGTTLELVTAERVRVVLALPPGAVSEPVPITLTAKPPAHGAWTAVEVETDPPGLIFQQPATLTLELPPGLTFPADTAVAFTSGPELAIAGTAAEAGPTLAIETWMLGRAPEPADAKPADDDTYWQRFEIAARAFDTATLVAALTQLYDDLAAERRFQDAVGVHVVLTSVLQRRDEPEWEAVAGAAVDMLRAGACAALAGELTELVTPDDCASPTAAMPAACYRCNWQLAAPSKAMFGMVAIQQMVGEVRSEQPCPAALAWREAANTEIVKLSAFIRATASDPEAYCARLRCECDNPAPGARPPGCLQLDTSSPTCTPPAVAPGLAHATLPDPHWDVALDVIDGDHHAYDDLGAVGSDDGPAYNAALAEADEASYHELAFAHCLSTRDMSPLGALASIVATPDVLRADAQHCASALELTSRDGSLEVVATASAAPPERGVTRPPVSIRVVEQGSLELRGPVATLVCRPMGFAAPGEREADVITIFAHAGATRVPLETLQANGAADVVPATLAFTVHVSAARAALGLLPGAPFELSLERSGPGCDGQFAPTELFRVRAAVHEDRLVHIMDTMPNGNITRLRAFRIDASGATPIFDAATPDLGLGVHFPTSVGNAIYLRRTNRYALAVRDPDGIGWGFLNADGSVDVQHPPGQFEHTAPTRGDHRGIQLVIGETLNAGQPDAQLVWRVLGPTGVTTYPSSIRVFAVSPAGELLGIALFDGLELFVGSNGTWTTTGITNVRNVRFMPDGNTFVIHYTGAATLIARDRITGTEQPLPIDPTTTSWAAEDGGILFLEGTTLKRYDLASAEITTIGPVPPGAHLRN